MFKLNKYNKKYENKIMEILKQILFENIFKMFGL